MLVGVDDLLHVGRTAPSGETALLVGLLDHLVRDLPLPGGERDIDTARLCGGQGLDLLDRIPVLDPLAALAR